LIQHHRLGTVASGFEHEVRAVLTQDAGGLIGQLALLGQRPQVDGGVTHALLSFCLHDRYTHNERSCSDCQHTSQVGGLEGVAGEGLFGRFGVFTSRFLPWATSPDRRPGMQGDPALTARAISTLDMNRLCRPAVSLGEPTSTSGRPAPRPAATAGRLSSLTRERLKSTQRRVNLCSTTTQQPLVQQTAALCGSPAAIGRPRTLITQHAIRTPEPCVVEEGLRIENDPATPAPCPSLPIGGQKRRPDQAAGAPAKNAFSN